MVVGLRTISDDKLIVKDILNIDLDMEVVKVDDTYKVKVTKDCYLDGTFKSEEDAELAIYNIANLRNSLEQNE